MISVIVPVYNVFPYLRECVATICRQTFTDLEILLIDDGSTDESGALCDDFAKRDTRIKVIHQKNQGLSCARNTGIEQAGGEYLVFIDSDDRIHPEMIQIMYNAMCQYDVELVICSHKRIQEKEPQGCYEKKVKVEAQDTEVLSGRECIKRTNTYERVDMTVAWNKLYRKSLFQYLRYPIGRMHEDEFLTYKILYSLKECVYIKIPLYEYRMREGSIMGNKNICRLKDKLDATEEKCHFFEQKEDKELYYEALCRYETSIAEVILALRDMSSEVVLRQELEQRFKALYWEKVISSPIPFRHKVKHMIFMKAPKLYQFLKNMDERRNRSTVAPTRWQ